VPLAAFVERSRRFAESSRGVTVLVGIALYILGTALWAGDWLVALGALGFIGLAALSPVIALLPMTRRVLKAGGSRGDIIHALAVDLERDRERREFQYGKAAPAVSRVTRRVAYGGLGLIGVATALSFVGLSAAVGYGAIAVGVVAAAGAAFFGGFYSRRRLNIAGEWALKLWRSRLGQWMARLAGVGIEGQPAVDPPAPEPAAGQPDYVPVSREGLRARVAKNQAALDEMVQRLRAVPTEEIEVTGDVEALERLRDAVEGAKAAERRRRESVGGAGPTP
jgi:hypothetical protein